MSKLLLSLLSFIAGICVTLLTGSRMPSLDAQSVSNITFVGGQGMTSGIRPDPAAVPVVKPLNPTLSVKNVGIRNSHSQQLDGLKCNQCRFEDATLTYGGGAFDLKNSSITGTTRLQLTGAAANTVALLDLLRGIQVDSPPKMKDIERKAKVKRPINQLNFSPPFDGGTFIGPGQ
jgi:hypothetical protein